MSRSSGTAPRNIFGVSRGRTACRGDAKTPFGSILRGPILWLVIAAIPFGGTLSAESPSIDFSEKTARKHGVKNLLTPEFLDALDHLPGDLGPLASVPIPQNNPQTPAKVELGKMLFFDQRLSADQTLSCAACHDPQKGYSDGRARPVGPGGRELKRHSPTLINIAYVTAHYWDGRAATLEEQARLAIESPTEMNLNGKEAARRLNAIPEYKKRFQQVFGEPANIDNIAKAIAAFERTIVTEDSPFDRYMKGDKQALTVQEKRGLALFVGKGICSQCHSGPNFADSKFYSLGVPPSGLAEEDLGRYHVTKDKKDKYAFKTTTVRNVTQTAPYMHNGALETLEQVVEFYHRGGGSARFNKSASVVGLHLTNQEKKDLVAFMKALTGKLPEISAPTLPKNETEHGKRDVPWKIALNNILRKDPP